MPAIIIGQSAGGWGTLAFASRNPARIAAFINVAAEGCDECAARVAVYLGRHQSDRGGVSARQGDSLVEDLVWVRATTLDIFVVTVATQSDAWLPFSLTGQSQSEIYHLNADRLADALQDIHRETGFNLEAGLVGVRAVMKGFRLENFRYTDGSIADVS